LLQALIAAYLWFNRLAGKLMYSLYFECPDGRLEWICDVNDAARAKTIARFSSKDGRTVTIVRSFEDGATGVLATFQRGTSDALGSLTL
jgi:hypothetical protein